MGNTRLKVIYCHEDLTKQNFEA